MSIYKLREQNKCGYRRSPASSNSEKNALLYKQSRKLVGLKKKIKKKTCAGLQTAAKKNATLYLRVKLCGNNAQQTHKTWTRTERHNLPELPSPAAHTASRPPARLSPSPAPR